MGYSINKKNMKKTVVILALAVISICAKSQTKDTGIYLGSFQIINVDSSHTEVRFAAKAIRVGDTDKTPMQSFIYPIISYPSTWNQLQILGTANDSINAYVKRNFNFGTK